MKKILIIAIATIALTSCANRLGDLTMLSNRNYDKSQSYVLLQRDVKVKVKTKKDDIIERLVDKATSSVNGGEYLANATLWVTPSGKKMIVKGDVWGVAPVEVVKQPEIATTKVNVESSVTKKNELNTGDKVTFKSTGKLVEGVIIGINTNGAIVEFTNLLGKPTKKEIPFDELTKIEK